MLGERPGCIYNLKGLNMKTGLKTIHRRISPADIRRSLKSTSGVTLVELMVAVGLFGVLSAALTQVFVGFMEQNTRSEREIELNESLREFTDRLDLELGNMTQLLGCSCGVSRCVYNDDTSSGGVNCASTNCGSTLLLWETETAQSTGSASSAGACNGSTSLRGCKKFRKLVLTRPAANGTTPGKIEIQDATSGQILASISGITQAYCGRNNDIQTTGFKVRVQAKSRNKNNSTPSSPDFESWSLAQPSGARGIHRELTAEVNFRNLNSPGVHFGNSSTLRSCVADGSATNNANQCCSNYRSSSTGRCLARSQCKKSGESPDTTRNSCCSLQIKTDSVSGSVTCL
jgi:prepilin-type N-terminal cleavage/methylation domain-containing protein